MTESELQKLLDELLVLPAETEWVEFKEANNSYDFNKLGKYVSALSNEANLKNKRAAWLLFGIHDRHEVVGSQYRTDRTKLDSLKKEVADQTSNRLSFTEIHELYHPKGRVIFFEIPPAPSGMPTAWGGHFYGREGESLAPLSLVELEQIRGQTEPDWSAEVCSGATCADLDPDALARARQNYKIKHPTLAGEVDRWSDSVLLNKAKVTIGGRITRTAILLLGHAESAHFLSPAQAQITWVLKDALGNEKDYEHFNPPFLLKTDILFSKIRNLTYRYMQDNTLFPTEIQQYDPWVIRELLHNCVAHQDYRLRGRINVVEQEDSLLFSNPGGFIPKTVEHVITSDSPPDHYRNPFLAQAMVELNMIDTIGSGIRRVFNTQRQRFFPLPDYDLTDDRRVMVKLFGKVLDESYTRMLMHHADLDLGEVMALDRVQKNQRLNDNEFRLLKRKKLVEGRRPNLIVAAHIAEATGQKAIYIRNRAFDKQHYKKMVLEYLERFDSATPKDIETLLIDKLPEILDGTQKKTWVKNLLQEMSKKDQSICNAGGRGNSAQWKKILD
ncbi:RNA-binding domain-containing protein [Mariprofundus ferrooxydans]|uniref:RNA-binding domain-containing protein n=1 Tax=Mariprofundus ferrooxydans TaxID=314344 RepID=UPI00142FC4D0|nr:RNA-binding domain-containing protein [Mariprofundus ferrooxydans]